MAFLDQIGGLLEQYASGGDNVTRDQAHTDYDRIANAVPPNILGSIIGPALSSLGGPQVEERIRNSAQEMTPDTRGKFLQSLLTSATEHGINVGSVLSQLGIDSAVQTQPNQASADDVARVAAQLHQSHPGAFNQAMTFFSQHPTLVKVLGTLAITKIAQQLQTRGPQPAR